MGTPAFAVGILDALYQSEHEIVGVITVADKPAGRGQKVSESAVKVYAKEKGLRLLQPTNLKCELFLEELKALNANLQIVVAFRMLPEVVWQMPKYGTFNLHASLLPQYRGAAPINWAIINGDEATGVTTFFIDEKIDTGAIILNDTLAIEPNENAGSLHDKLMHLGCELVVKTVDLISEGNVVTSIQEETATLKSANKLNKENCKIDWQQKGSAIYNLIRGLDPYPSAWTVFQDETNEWNVKINAATFVEESHNYSFGKILTTKKELKIAVTNGFIIVNELQFPGKRKMKTHELLNGIRFSENAIVL